MGGQNNLPVADRAPVTVMGHKVYATFIEPGSGLRNNDTRGIAVDDESEGTYWVIDGEHYNNGCRFDYGNAETDSRDDGNGTIETTYFGNATAWYRGTGKWPVGNDRPGEQPRRLREPRQHIEGVREPPNLQPPVHRRRGQGRAAPLGLDGRR